MAAKIKKGDKVVILTGRDKGKTGEVVRSIPRDGKLIVSGVNMVKRHNRPTQGSPGGIEEKEAPIQASNVAIVDPKTGEPTRVGFEIRDGKSVRVARKSGEVIDV